ncbi:hypothetical protein [Butyrivibrio sp. NC3005]|uniref:hypothetical protein n=1 Tax=Butyrivibrio sp. NC3005 TaxID=1280685 RepID=UPI000428D71B|nr:hypothetical protein [Butyrivibrio sp. NC3005]
MKILILKTSVDATFDNLIGDLCNKNHRIICLVPSSHYAKYKTKYSYVKLIDIKNEGFYDLPISVMKKLKNQKFDEVYITLSGVVGHNYGNVISILELLKFKKAFFYNSNGDRIEIPKQNLLFDFLCGFYICLLNKIC